MGRNKEREKINYNALINDIEWTKLESVAKESGLSKATIMNIKKEGASPGTVDAIGKYLNKDPEYYNLENQEGIARLEKASWNPYGIDDLFSYGSDFIECKKAKEDPMGFLRNCLAFAGIASAFDVLTEQEKIILIMEIESGINESVKKMHPDFCPDFAVPDPESATE